MDHSAFQAGGLYLLLWLGLQEEEGKQRRQDQAVPKRQRPRDKARKRLTETD